MTSTHFTATGRVASLSVSSEGIGIGTIHYGYDYAGALDEISALGRTALYEYDFFGRLSRVESPEGVKTISYNTSGLRTQCVTQTDEGDYVETRTYDALGHLLTQTHTRPDGSISFQIEYTLAPDGNRLRAVETRDSDVVTWDYEYDRLGRLVREKRGDGETPSTWHRDISYTYNADSNRVGADNALDDDLDETYTYDTNGRLDRVTRGDATYTVYSWTANGEQQQVSEFNASHEETRRQTYTWGGTGDRTLAEVRLYERNASGTLVETGHVEYDYDHSGEKIARRVYNANGGLVSHRKYLIDHQKPTGYSQAIAELDIVDPATGNPSEASNAIARIARLNTFDPLGPVAQTDFARGDWIQNQQSDSVSCPPLSVTRRHLFADPLGSIRALTSRADSGTIQTVAEDYTAFGAPLNGSLTPGDPHAATPQYAFTAQTRDPYSGLQYHRARWLSTRIGRWITRDRVLDFPFNMGSAFGYGAANPVVGTDLSGLVTIIEALVVAVAIVALAYVCVSIFGGPRGVGKFGAKTLRVGYYEYKRLPIEHSFIIPPKAGQYDVEVRILTGTSPNSWDISDIDVLVINSHGWYGYNGFNVEEKWNTTRFGKDNWTPSMVTNALKGKRNTPIPFVLLYGCGVGHSDVREEKWFPAFNCTSMVVMQGVDKSKMDEDGWVNLSITDDSKGASMVNDFLGAFFAASTETLSGACGAVPDKDGHSLKLIGKQRALTVQEIMSLRETNTGQ